MGNVSEQTDRRPSATCRSHPGNSALFCGKWKNRLRPNLGDFSKRGRSSDLFPEPVPTLDPVRAAELKLERSPGRVQVGFWRVCAGLNAQGSQQRANPKAPPLKRFLLSALEERVSELTS